MALRALSLDLDDTLWPVWPTIRQAEARLQQWLQEFAPATHAAHDRAAMQVLRRAVVQDRPDWAHDLSALRQESIRRALLAAGDDPALAGPAFEAFFEARHQVTLFDDVLPALTRLAARYPLLALSNGNAQVQRVPGLGRFFSAALSARDLGLAKPAPEVFMAVCARAGCAPHKVLHIGDDAMMDVDGALAAGLQAAWVQRPELAACTAMARPTGRPQHVVADLLALVDRLGC